MVARSFRYSCLVLVAIVANFSDLRGEYVTGITIASLVAGGDRSISDHYLCAAFSALITFARTKSANVFPLANVAPWGTGGPNIGTSLLLDTATLY